MNPSKAQPSGASHKTVSSAEETPAFVEGIWAVRYQVKDVSRAVTFYTGHLGFKLDRQNLPAFAQVSIYGFKLILSGPGASGSRPMPDGRSQEPGGSNRIVLRVTNLSDRVETLKKAGLRFRNDMEVGPGGKQIQLEDPDGNPIELFEPASKGENFIEATHGARHISVSINRPPNEVYDFASNPKNLPQWATGLGGSIKSVGGGWIADSPMGKIKIRFAEQNKFRVLDHDVILESGEKVHNSMRVVPCGEGSEVIFTVLRRPEMSDEKYREDVQWVEKDLNILKGILERRP